jgi:hypothetical protein
MSDSEDFPDDISYESEKPKKEKKENVLKKPVKQFSDKELSKVNFHGALAMHLFTDKNIKCWALRISKVKGLELDKTFDFFASHQKYSVVVVSEEGTHSTIDYHHHCLLRGNVTRKDVVTDLKVLYPDCKGNPCFSISEARDQKQLLKYTLKEGEYLSRGIPETVLALAKKLSSPKTDLNKKLVDIYDALLMGNITMKDYARKYIQIKVDHRQNIYPHHIAAHLRTVAMASGELTVDDFSDNLLDNALRLQ